MRRTIAIALAFLPTLALADIIHLADGTMREGRVVEANEKEVVLEVGQGGVSLAVRIPRSQVVKIEEKPTGTTAIMAEYVTRLANALKSKSADDWHALGLWCREQRGFRDKAAEAFDRALALDPNHVPTHVLLGHVRVNDAWMSRQQAIQFLFPDLEENAKLRELEFQRQLEEAKAAAAQAEARNKALEAKLAELRRDIEDLRQRLALPVLPPDYFRPRVIYRPYIIVPPRPHPRPHPDKPTPPPKDTPPAEPPPKSPSPKAPPPKPPATTGEGDTEKPTK
ncbi:MAG: tetratricopeptide repeat protein [Planctomycetes bacterium]|nr:tetratricopeptide repeat protein [Planctomycetota bacterium]